MSLILEALKRSEAERRLGEAPDLLAPPPEFVTSAPARSPPAVLVAGIVVVIALGIAFAWWWFALRGADDVRPRIAATPAGVIADASNAPPRASAPAESITPALLGVPAHPNSSAVASTPLPTPGATPTIAPNPIAPLLPPDTVAGNSPVVVETLPAPEGERPPEAPTPIPVTDPALAVAQPAPAPIEVAPPPPVSAIPEPAVAAPPTPTPELVQESPASDMPHLSDLPLAVRQSLPPLVLNMHLYRATPSERVVILDGKRVREGESAGDIQIIEIRSDGVVLVAQGQRFLLSRMPR